MRRLYWAVPFMVYSIAYLLWEFQPTIAFFLVLDWLAFLIEYRYGGESKKGEEMTVFGVAAALVILPLGGYVTMFAEVITAFMFSLELAGAFVKIHRG